MLAAVKITPLDWVVIALYLVGIIGLGVWLGRGQKTTRDYFLGGRDLPWWSVAFSIVATETSALTFIGVPAMAYGGNLMFIQIVIGCSKRSNRTGPSSSSAGCSASQVQSSRPSPRPGLTVK